MKIRGEYVLREIAGDYILVPIGSTAMEMNGMITLNEVGVLIWRKLSDGAEYEDIIQAILEEYDTSVAQAREDLDEFLEKMKESNLIDD